MIPFQFLGPYRVGEPIGRGGMGTVYRGVHEKSGQPVAVKLIAMTVADDPRFRRRFADEVETLKRLKHRNIVALIGYGEQSGHLFYSMELVKGESLQQKLRREKRLPWPLVLDMAIDICAALKHAHDFGVIHRDLKPANLLFDDQGAVKLVDFGIAKLFGNQDQTAAGSVLGTADFMAPEQAGGGAITPRTDLYALGNVLYACFAGRPPFGGRTLTRVIESLRQEAPARIDLIAPELPPEIAELIHDLLEKRPEDRPPTALAVMNRLKAIRAGLHHMATRLHSGSETLETPPAQNQGGHPSDLPDDQLTAAPAADDKTLGRFDDEELTLPAPAEDQMTVEAAYHAAAPRRPLTPAQASRPKAAAEIDTAKADASTAAQTHFRTIDEQDRHRSARSRQWYEDEVGSRFWHSFAIAAMVVALVLGVVIVLWAMRSPSADQLYAAFVQTHQSGNTEAARTLSEQFIRLYPEDSRVGAVADALAALDAHRVEPQLRRAVRDGGIAKLAPDEQAFLYAVEDRDWDPLLTQTRLEQWMDVFAPAGQPAHAADQSDSPDAGGGSGRVTEPRMMIHAVQMELRNAAAAQQQLRDWTAANLLERIDWARENLSAQEQRKLLQGTVALFSEHRWAQQAVAEAQRRLAELDR